MIKRRVAYRIEGIVQGVGFRPFIYTLSLHFGLKGFVLNNTLGVYLEVEGSDEALCLFDEALYAKLPPLARLDFVEKTPLDPIGYASFEIHHSEVGESKSSLVLPDMALCDDCMRELLDASNRRHHYFFINCTNCGPRYSIIRTVPYDRPNTSMQPFVMCDACQEEYTNPLDRRYHAQPISCATCGPSLYLKHISGEVLAYDHDAILRLASLIKEGKSVAMKGMGGFHLMCDASSDEAVRTLRERKQRPHKPFAVMFKNFEAVEAVCSVSSCEKEALLSQLRPIVLLKRADKSTLALSDLVAPFTDRLGVFLPYTPLHVMLFEYLSHPIIATSANRSGEPIISDEVTLQKKLSHVVEYYLDYNREIVHSSDDSVVQYCGEKALLMRLSRGIAPLSVRVPSPEKRPILAIGVHQKNAIAIYLNQQVIVSPYIGDLDNLATCELFEKMISALGSFYDATPELIVGDKHPYYASIQWAKKQAIPFLQIQHHYAHILSAMFEHHLDETVLGIAWDGTGYGDDGTLWGGEFFVCDTHTYERVASFEPFYLLGGDASIKETRRVLASLLWDLEDRGYDVEPLLLAYFDAKELKNLKQLYVKKINAPLCSSVGRIFDAVAIICGMDARVSYDGQSGLFLETLYDERIQEAYTFTCKEGVVLYKEVLWEMFQDNDPRTIASKFINALAHLVQSMTTLYGRKTILSGGVFQNRTLVEKILSFKNDAIYTQHRLPPNDGGVCVGQIYYALQNSSHSMLEK